MAYTSNAYSLENINTFGLLIVLEYIQETIMNGERLLIWNWSIEYVVHCEGEILVTEIEVLIIKKDGKQWSVVWVVQPVQLHSL